MELVVIMMKKLNETIKTLAKDRILLLMMFVVFLIGISFSIFMIANVKQVDHLLYSRYTIYGTEHYYRDRWFYRIAIASFGLLIAFIHNFIIAKLYNNSGRNSALIMAFFSIFIAVLGFFIMFNVVNIPN